MTKTLFNVAVVLVGVCSLSLGSAQELINPAPASADQLEEVVVTAEKTQQDLQKTTLSIATISGDDLQKLGKTTLEDTLATVPAVTIDGGPAGFLVRIRGAGLDLPPNIGSPAVAVSRDGAFDKFTLTTFLSGLDVNHVEVLRGPQGTLYGQNSTGGAVNIISNDPADHFQAAGGVDVGNYQLLHFDGMVNVPLSDDLSLRVAGMTNNHSGYLSNGQNDADNQAARAKVLWKPSADTSILFGAEYAHIDGAASGAVLAFGTEQPKNPWIDPNPSGSFYRNLDQKYWINAQTDLGFGVLTILPVFQKLAGNWFTYFTPNPSFVPPAKPTYLANNQEQKSADVRLASHPGAAVTWVAGLYYYDFNTFYTQNTILPGENIGLNFSNPTTYPWLESTEKVVTEAAYGQVTVPIVAQLKATVGLRATHDSVHQLYLTNSTVAPDFVNLTPTANSVNYKLGLQDDLTPTSLVYGDLSTSHLPGGANVYTNSNFKPERVTSYEIGTKNRFLDNRLQVNADVFYTDYRDFQVTEFVAILVNGIPQNELGVSEATAHSYGSELESTWIATKNDKLGLGVAFLHARYGTFAAPSQQANNNTPLTGAPDWTLTPSWNHAFAFADGSALTAHVDTRYHTNWFLAPGGRAGQGISGGEEPAHTVSNASLTYASASGVWDLTAHIANIEDHATKEGAFPFVDIIGDPRTYGVSFTAHFDGSASSK